MFVRYQTIRNLVLLGALGLGGGIFFWVRSPFSNIRETSPSSVSSRANGVDALPHDPSLTSRESLPQSQLEPAQTPAMVTNSSPPVAEQNPESSLTTTDPTIASSVASVVTTNLQNTVQDQGVNLSQEHEVAERYVAAMRIAHAPATPGKGKDVLGASSPWKLNLYDDDQNGFWDRAKLDTNRDENDDEKWNLKDGRWEKDGGNWIWSVNTWVLANSLTASAEAKPANTSAAEGANPTIDLATASNLDRYRAAMKIANGPAMAGKGKDVLGAHSPWKLNLYDDDHDGRWDRGKLDVNRDEQDDEKWNFKQGRWEKEGGSKIWNGHAWTQP